MSGRSFGTKEGLEQRDVAAISAKPPLQLIPFFLARYCKKGIFSHEVVVEFLDEGVRAELEALPLDIVASFLRISRLIESRGLHMVHEPYVKHLEGPVWEMRMKGKERDRPRRLRHCHRPPHRHRPRLREEDAETPRREIDTALRRAKEVL